MFKRFWWIFPICLVAGPLLGLLIGGVIAYVSPKQYESTATIQVRPPSHSTQVLAGQISDPTGSNCIATEVEVISSQATLDPVIDQLDLVNRWGVPRNEALENLRQSVDARNIEGTDLIEIRVRTTSPNDSKVIAEAVSDAYRSRRAELERERTDKALDELREAVRLQEDLIEEKRKVLTQLIRNETLLWPPNANAPSYPRPKTAEARSAKLETQKIRLESQIDTLLRYEGDELITYAAGLNTPDNIVKQLHPQWVQAKRQLKTAKLSGLGKSHPSVRQQEKIIAGLEKDIEEGVVALRETLQAQLELAKEQAERLRINKDEEQAQEPVANNIQRLSFDDAKTDFETAQSLLEQLKIKLISEEMQRRISEDPVIIHENPVEAIKPASPHVLLLLLLGAGGGLLLGLVAPFVVIPILHALTKPITG